MTTQKRRDFGAYLARLRGTKSQSALAAELCDITGTDTVTRHEVSRWERGERIPDDWLPHLARVHNIPLTVLERMAADARGKDTGPEAIPFDLSAFFPDAVPLKTRIANAWHGRAVANAGGNPTLVLVGGYAGSGKTEFARFLSDLSGWAFLDKDALTRRLSERLLISLNGDPHDRHTDLYRDEVRPHEYRCLLSTAYANIDSRVSIILAAPFIDELNDPAWLPRLTHRCQANGVDVTAIWVHSDIDTMHEYIEQRDAARDAWKLANWDEYTAGLNTDNPPDTAHLTIDNRLGAAVSLADQTRRALTKLIP
ncbi:AAA family ATPase [Actinomadura roseirufa]|uniref:AAA family ATPase n=1 Tax=Actinomadura roseirufa TaxID=2094049 RepID=UPI001F5FE679|nr:AAA family ATPase [Actinomadura roseirufa]